MKIERCQGCRGTRWSPPSSKPTCSWPVLLPSSVPRFPCSFLRRAILKRFYALANAVGNQLMGAHRSLQRKKSRRIKTIATASKSVSAEAKFSVCHEEASQMATDAWKIRYFTQDCESSCCLIDFLLFWHITINIVSQASSF